LVRCESPNIDGSALSEAKPAKRVWLRWPDSMKVRRSPSASSQAISEDIELGPTPLQDTSAITSPGEPAPANTGHIHWALEHSIREETHSTLHQRHNLAHTGASNSHGRLSAADDERSESQSANAPHDANCSSCDSGEEVRRRLDITTPAIGSSPNPLTSEVEKILARRSRVSSFRTDQYVEMVPWLSRQVTIGRNSNFQGLSAQDREELGGIEYRSLKILLKILIGKSPVYCCGRHVSSSNLPARTLSRPAYDRRYRSLAVDHTWALAIPRVLGIARARQSVVVSV
jgi:hypothetical protein